jgi:hypothetical protein
MLACAKQKRVIVPAHFPGLTLTGMYSVLEKLRAGEALNAKEKQIHDEGLVSVLRQLHDDLDAAVFAAYGWPATLTDAEILVRVVALNAERAKEEAAGLVRWLRPEYQNPDGAQAHQSALAIPTLNPQPPSQAAVAEDAVGKSQDGEHGVGGGEAAGDRRRCGKGFCTGQSAGRRRDTGNALHDGPRAPRQGGWDVPALKCQEAPAGIAHSRSPRLGGEDCVSGQ